MTNYVEALKWANNLMVRSGIREFCQTICKGGCCGDRVGGRNDDCHKNIECHDKLPCVMYVCSQLRGILEREAINDQHLTDDLLYQLYRRTSIIACQISDHLKLPSIGKTYFGTYSLQDVQDIEFDFDLPVIPDKELQRIQSCLNGIENWKA